MLILDKEVTVEVVGGIVIITTSTDKRVYTYDEVQGG
jgi:hypothetical protein